MTGVGFDNEELALQIHRTRRAFVAGVKRDIPCSSLPQEDQKGNFPRLSDEFNLVPRPSHSAKTEASPMANHRSKIVIEISFIPSQSTVCRTADALLLATLLISGIAAVISAILKWYIA